MRRGTVRLFGTVSICLTAFVCGFAASAIAQSKHAFVVGIDKYDHLPANAQLQKAVGDAHAMSGVLGGLGFSITAAHNATRSGFNQRWQEFLDRIKPGDSAAIVFSGHGVEIGGVNYLLPRDVPRIRLGRDELLKRESLSLAELLADLRERKPLFSFVVIDACRDNPFAEGGRSLGAPKGLARVEPPEGTFIMFSAGAYQTALDRLSDTDVEATSVYTRALLPLLKTPGLTLLEMADRVGEQVRDLAARVSHKQTPAFYSNVVGGRRVCLAGCTGSTAQAKTPDAIAQSQLEAMAANARAEAAAERARTELEMAKSEGIRLKSRSELEAAQTATARAEAALARMRAEAEQSKLQRDAAVTASRSSVAPSTMDTATLFNQAAAPSFNCREYAIKPVGHPERNPQTDVFCIEPDAAAVDSRLGQTFREYIRRFSQGDRSDVVRVQKQWILQRNQQCTASWDDLSSQDRRRQIAQCLIAQTNARIQALQR
jgi:uncharacterized protein YecT (DUF1311 family)